VGSVEAINLVPRDVTRAVAAVNSIVLSRAAEFAQQSGTGDEKKRAPVCAQIKKGRNSIRREIARAYWRAREGSFEKGQIVLARP
jgi:hypothetical protein